MEFQAKVEVSNKALWSLIRISNNGEGFKVRFLIRPMKNSSSGFTPVMVSSKGVKLECHAKVTVANAAKCSERGLRF